MYIKRILSYDKEGLEADVLISDGQQDLLCYAQPFDGDKNTKFQLTTFGCGDVVRSYDNQSLIKKSDEGYYSYEMSGKLLDAENAIVMVFGFIIGLDAYIPKDIRNGEYVDFKILH